NVDIRSFFLNFELGVFIYSGKEIEALSAGFETDLLSAQELDAALFRRRPRLSRLLEDTARIFSPLF
ncbi:MAG TPA: hypothetical protein VFF01_04905, partial [Candidatus Deferrimicrobiaceae bacterium]|nr:hypothetical protein [Candidatus Deferrimicrobiaceae bacterium]